MRVLLALSLLVAIVNSSAPFVTSIQASQVDELRQSGATWLVFEGNVDEALVQKASVVFSVFAKVAHVNIDTAPSLNFFIDSQTFPYPVKPTDAAAISQFLFSKFDSLISDRSKQARKEKQHEEFLEREKERIKKQHEEETALRHKSPTIVLTAQNWQTSFMKVREAILVNAYEANCTSCREFNKKWEEITAEFKDRIKVTKINLTESQSLRPHFKSDRYPSVRFYTAGTKDTTRFYDYGGNLKVLALSDWVQAKMKEKVQQVDIETLSASAYSEKCKNSKATCIVAFIDTASPDGIEQFGAIQSLASKHLSKPINFFLALKGSQASFQQQTGVSSYPDIVMMYPKLKKMWRQGTWNIQVTEDVIEQIALGNRNEFVKYSFTEDIK